MGLGAMARADEGLSLPHLSTGTIRRSGRETVVELPYGRVRVGNDAVKSRPNDTPAPGPVQGENKGVFSLKYNLVFRNGRFETEGIKVTVSNRAVYHAEATPRLREHEAVHAEINRRAGVSIQKSLSGFVSTAPTAIGAERELKKQFRDEVARVMPLHKDWDDNHVFLSTPTLNHPR